MKQHIWMQHLRFYREQKIEQLKKLINILKNEPLFICDIEPPINIKKPVLFKVTDYPLWLGGIDCFSIGIEEQKSFRLLPFWKYSEICLVGELQWTFKGNSFENILIILNSKTIRKYSEMLNQISILLKAKIGCNVMIINDDIRQSPLTQ